MSRTRQQVVFRIHELRSKLESDPPSYEDVQMEDTLKRNASDEVPCLPSDAEILFTIAGKVQIFYINVDGNVSAPSYPSSLFIFKFKCKSSNFEG